MSYGELIGGFFLGLIFFGIVFHVYDNYRYAKQLKRNDEFFKKFEKDLPKGIELKEDKLKEKKVSWEAIEKETGIKMGQVRIIDVFSDDEGDWLNIYYL